MEELNLNKTEEQNPIKVKKLYNPFKMRGSWIGLTMALFYSFTYGTSSLGIPLIFNIFIGWIFILYFIYPLQNLLWDLEEIALKVSVCFSML